MRTRFFLGSALSFLGAFALMADPATGWLQTAAGTYDYNDPANWVNGEINGIFGSDLTLAGNQTLTLASDTTLETGLELDFRGGYRLTFVSDDTAITRTLALGGDIDAAASTKNAGLTFSPSLIVDLGGVERTVYTASGNFGVTFNGTIQNGALALNNAGGVTLAGNSTYAGGTTTLGAGGISFNSSTAFGTGPIIFNSPSTTIQCDNQNRTLLANNPIVFNGNINASLNSNKARNFGYGEITILKPITISVGKNTLSFLGQVAAESPYGMDAITKTGSATLVTEAALFLENTDATLDVQGGFWRFNGSISGEGTLTKAGNGTLVLNNTNTLDGTLLVQGGAVQFLSPNSYSPNANIVFDGGGFAPSSSFTTADLFALGLPQDSVPQIFFASNEGGSIDARGFPGIVLGAVGGYTFSGTITVDPDATVILGGGGGTLTLSGQNAIPANVDVVTIQGIARLTGLNDAFTGTIQVLRGAEFGLYGANGALPNADLVTNRGKIDINLNGASGSDERIRAKNILLKTGSFRFFGSGKANSFDSISGDIILDVADAAPDVFGGINSLEFRAYDGKTATFTAQNLIRRNNAVASIASDASFGSADSGQVPRFFLTNPPELIGGGGADGTTTISIYPFALFNGNNGTYTTSFLTYGANGFRGLNRETEYLSALPCGEVTTHNVRLPYNHVEENTAETTINALLFQGIEAKQASNTILNGDETLHVASGAIHIGYLRNNSTTVNCPIDFGSSQGVISFPRGKGTSWNHALHGTAGAIFFQGSETAGTGSGGSGLTIGGNSVLASTLSGDVVVFGNLNSQVTGLWVSSEDRPLRLHAYGVENGSTTTAYEHLEGHGRIYRGRDTTLSFGIDNTDALFEGGFGENTKPIKVGTGTQRLTGTSTHNQPTTVSEGTLQLDGSFTQSSITVAEGATLAGCGSVTKAVTLQAGATLALGSDELPEDLAFEFGNTLTFGENTTLTFPANNIAPTTSAIVQGTVLGDGVTVEVLPRGDGCGEWLILEAPSIAPAFVAGQRSGRIERRQTNSGEQIWFIRTRGTILLFR